MYGYAGAKHAPGMPDINSKASRLATYKLSAGMKPKKIKANRDKAGARDDQAD